MSEAAARRRRLVVRRLGRVEYEDGLALQDALAKARAEGGAPDTLLLLEHPPVLTLGRGADGSNVIAPREELARLGIELFETNRGGDVTYHGPGQLVGYPILDLKPDRQDVRRYVRDVEEALIRALARFGVEAGRIPRWTGVWVGEEADPEAAKIAAIGVHIRRWVTTHGFALNVRTDLSHFRTIVPCGIAERGVTSLAKLRGEEVADLEAVAGAVAESFGEVLGWDVEERGVDAETISVAVTRDAPGGLEALVLTRNAARGGFRQLVTGRIEPGELPLAAAQRELREETGLDARVRPLGYVHAFGFGEGPAVLREHAFAAHVPAGARVAIDPGEHVEASWLPVEAALAALPFAGLRRALRLAAAR